MAKPPSSGPHSDIEGVNRDARAGSTAKSTDAEPGTALDDAEQESRAQPDEQPDTAE